jgi:hypothetical protein
VLQQTAEVQNLQASANLSSMDSYALGLLLGGLRGPLVMFLWSTSESQKTAHDLQDFDTKVEWIRLLQPEFDSVHLFQIWNKAYNISVQMANIPNKYSAILDGLDYASSVNRQRPDDINIIFDMARVWSDKLGTSHEAKYYIPRVRRETMAPRAMAEVTMPTSLFSDFMDTAHAAGMDLPIDEEEGEAQDTVVVKVDAKFAPALRAKFASMNDVTFQDIPVPKSSAEGTVRRGRLDPMLDADGNILAKFLVPIYRRPADLPAGAPWYDGSDLQFLKDYQPFPDGLSPQAIGYNYYRRSQMLQIVAGASTIQTSVFVVDSRPALQQKFWGDEEAEEGRRAELRLFGLDDSGEKVTLESACPGTDTQHPLLLTQGMPPELSKQPNPAAGDRAIREYALASRLYNESKSGLQTHLLQFPRDYDIYRSHIDDDLALSQLYAADRDFLVGLTDPSRRETAWDSAAKNYTLARENFALIILRYWVDDELAAQVFPPDPATGLPRTRSNIDQIPPEQYVATLKAVMDKLDQYNQTHNDQSADDRDENLRFVRHCAARLRLLGR